MVDSWTPFNCVDFLLYFQAFEIVELSFVGLKLCEELVVASSSCLAARVHLWSSPVRTAFFSKGGCTASVSDTQSSTVYTA